MSTSIIALDTYRKQVIPSVTEATVDYSSYQSPSPTDVKLSLRWSLKFEKGCKSMSPQYLRLTSWQKHYKLKKGFWILLAFLIKWINLFFSQYRTRRHTLRLCLVVLHAWMTYIAHIPNLLGSTFTTAEALALEASMSPASVNMLNF